jgi:hypothetical protein
MAAKHRAVNRSVTRNRNDGRRRFSRVRGQAWSLLPLSCATRIFGGYRQSPLLRLTALDSLSFSGHPSQSSDCTQWHIVCFGSQGRRRKL